MRASFHLHFIHDERLIVRSLLLPRSVFLCVSLRRLPLLFHTLPALWPALLLSCGTAPRETPAAPSPNEEYCPFGDIPSSTGYEPNVLWRLPLLRDYWNDLPGGIGRHRYGAFVLVWCGTRQWDHRKSAIFTTVHSGARRTSEPETSLSLLWRKFVASSVLSRTHKNGETRTRTLFAPKTKIKSRNGKRKNQDSPWKTKRANSLAEVRSEIQKHELQAESDKRSIQEFLPPGLLVLDAFFTLCCVEDLGQGFGCVDFARLFISCRKLQLSPFEHCPLAFHCQQSPRLLCSRCFVPWFLTTAFVS